MAGYWPSSFFACLWTEREWRSINTQKQNEAISNHLHRTSLVNRGVSYGFRRNFSYGKRRVVPRGQDSFILPARLANHSAGFDSSCRSLSSWPYNNMNYCTNHFYHTSSEVSFPYTLDLWFDIKIFVKRFLRFRIQNHKYFDLHPLQTKIIIQLVRSRIQIFTPWP